jgi:hypothetical protein
MDDPRLARSLRESQHLMLTRPSDRRVEQAGDADPTGQSAVDRCFDESRRVTTVVERFGCGSRAAELVAAGTTGVWR